MKFKRKDTGPLEAKRFTLDEILSLAITALEEASQWANKAIVFEQKPAEQMREMGTP